MRIETSKDLRLAVRQGSYAWPGGYPLFFVMDDGACLNPSTVRDHYRQVLKSVRSKHNDGWRAISLEINYEDPDLYDSYTGDRIESAYHDQ